MRKLLYLFILAGAGSCVHYNNVKLAKTTSEKYLLQTYYSPCCGSCGERVVTDADGKQYGLQVNCVVDDIYSRWCSPREMGTLKTVMTFRKRRITSVSYYRAVYDTIELKKLHPEIDRGTYFDSADALKPVQSLSAIDSVLIKQHQSMTNKNICDNRHLQLIRGFVLSYVDTVFIYEKKRVKYKSKAKTTLYYESLK